MLQLSTMPPVLDENEIGERHVGLSTDDVVTTQKKKQNWCGCDRNSRAERVVELLAIRDVQTKRRGDSSSTSNFASWHTERVKLDHNTLRQLTPHHP